MRSRVGGSPTTRARSRVGALVGVMTIALLATLVFGVTGSSAQAGDDRVEARLRIRGTTGEEFFTVTGDGVTLFENDLGTTSWWTIPVFVPPTTETIRVNFLNDGLTTDGADRNIIVDWFEIDGDDGTTRIETESDTVLSLGVWNGSDCDEGYRNDEFLACNGWFQFDVGDLIGGPTPPPPDDTEPITVRAAGRQGSENLAISVDGRFIESFSVLTQPTDYTFNIPVVQDGPLRVEFFNDNGGDRSSDRDAYIPLITFRGVTYDTAELFSKGAWNGTDCGTGFRNSNWLHCNGWFQVPLESDPPNPDGPTVDGLVIAAGSTGTERIGLQVNGVLVDSWTLTADGVDRRIDVAVPEEGFEQVRVVFLNDGLTETGADRNVRFDWIELDSYVYTITDLLSKGVWNGTDCNEGYRNSQWLHCNGWLQLDRNPDPPPPPPPTVEPPTNVTCRFVAGNNGFGPWLYEWTWQNNAGGDVGTEVTVSRALEETVFSLAPGVSRFVHESGPPDSGIPDVVEIAAVSDDARGVATLSDCSRITPITPATLLTVPGPNQVDASFSAILAADDVDAFTVSILGSDLEERNWIYPDGRGGLYTTSFIDLPEDEVLALSVFTCYGDIPFPSCPADGRGIRYHPTTQIYVPNDAPPANAVMGSPENVRIDPAERLITWDAPTTTDGDRVTYQVRALLPEGFTDLQLAVGTLFRVWEITSEQAYIDEGLFYNWLPESDHRFEVRACSINGCGAWSESSDWISADGTLRPYQP